VSEALFYHLQNQPLEKVLPGLLEKCLERDWRVVVQVGQSDLLPGLNDFLWSYRADGFLPHGMAGEGHEVEQPILLTDQPDNPNSSSVRFLVARASPPDLAEYQRAVFLFDGNDPDAMADARLQWKAVKTAGHDATYWQQSDSGGWVKKA
jgi:DNA polymerase III subunit chi